MFECNYIVEESIVSRSNNDGTVVIMKMDESNTFFKINGVAAIVWKEMKDKKNLNEILKNIIAEYDAPEDKIINDMKEFIKTLEIKELIKKV